jgi:hypothetical protein
MKKICHAFTVDLTSRDGMKDICTGVECKQMVQLTYNIEEITNITFVEGVVLELKDRGAGVLRLDLPKEVLREFRAKGRFHCDKSWQYLPSQIKSGWKSVTPQKLEARR